MATKKSNSGFGIVITNEHGIRSYRGTKKALIAAGLCTEDQFPVARERTLVALKLTRRAPAFKRRFIDDKERCWELRRCKGGVFEFWRFLQPSERTSPPVRCSPEEFKVRVMYGCALWFAAIDEPNVIDANTGERLTFAPESYQVILDAMQALTQAIRSARVAPVRRNPIEVVRLHRA